MRERRIASGLVAGVLLGLTAVLVGGAAAVEVIAEPAARGTPEPVPVDPPDQGVLHCPVTAGEDETAALAVVPAGDEPTQVTVLRYDGEGPPARDEPVDLEPGAAHVVGLEGEAAQQPVGVRWDGGPAVATWQRGDGTAGAPCETAALPTWHVTGFDTTARNASTLHLFNPFAVDAVVRVTFGTPAGPVALVLTDNVLVPARSSVRLNLNEYEPEQPDLAATVSVLAGRVVAQGELRLRPTEHQPGPTGRALLPAVGGPELRWAFGTAREAGDAASWLVVHNPAERDAAVELRVNDPLADAEVLGREFSVPAGATTRIDLGEASEQAGFGLSLESVNDVPVVATRLAHTDNDGEDVAASVGMAPAQVWAAAGGRTRDRRASLALFNAGAEPVTVRVDAGEGTPEAWGAVEIAPNGRVALDLAEVGDRRALPLRVEADAPVAADLRVLTPGDDDVRVWSAALVPSSAWEGPGWRRPVRRDPTLSTTPIVPPVEDDAGEPPDG